ncbi:MAG: NAD-dependent epimerase/dehydratase family protein [Solirubrobacterales bacterium]|nr:NAD-dependent epimerase/dehydratase family protein [Solirubrobacterales bacterium]
MSGVSRSHPPPLPIFGDGTQTRTITHIDDIADGIGAAMSCPAGLNEDFNISAGEERTVAEIARVIWNACGLDPAAFALAHQPTFEVDVVRRWPSVERARTMLAGSRRSAWRRASPPPPRGCEACSERVPQRAAVNRVAGGLVAP